MKSNLEELLEHIPQSINRPSAFDEIKLGLLLDSIIAKSDKKTVIHKLKQVIHEKVYDSLEDLLNYLVMSLTFEPSSKIGIFAPVSFASHGAEFRSIDTFGDYFEVSHQLKNCLRTISSFENHTTEEQLISITNQKRLVGLLSVYPYFPGHLKVSLPVGLKNEEVKGAKLYQEEVMNHFRQLGYKVSSKESDDPNQQRLFRRNQNRRN